MNNLSGRQIYKASNKAKQEKNLKGEKKALFYGLFRM